MQQNKVQLQQQQQQQSNANGSSNSNNNNDCILLFEHQPVYTLGRGASVDHLTFLRKGNDHNAEEKEDDVLEDYRRRLCRTYRGNDASRLTCIDYSRQTNNGSIKTMAMSVEDEVTYLLQQQQHTPHPPPPVLAPNGAPIYRIERGGEVTFHGPGQLVLYPVLHLQHSSYQPDLHWYLHQIEEVIIQTLEYYNISSHRDTINTGVWVGTNKIAAVGVASSRWITSHGCALNVNPDLSYFGRDVITPCGIMAEGRGCDEHC
jgi:lipoyl(octanoyl) transferase